MISKHNILCRLILSACFNLIHLKIYIYENIDTSITPYCYILAILGNQKIDDFTGEQILETKWIEIGGSVWSTLESAKFERRGSDYFLTIGISGQADVFRIDRGTKVLIKTNDGMMELENQNSEISCKGCGTGKSIRKNNQGVSAVCNISRSQLSLLSKEAPQKIRIYLKANEYHDIDVNSKWEEDWIKAIEAVLSN